MEGWKLKDLVDRVKKPMAKRSEKAEDVDDVNDVLRFPKVNWSEDSTHPLLIGWE